MKAKLKLLEDSIDKVARKLPRLTLPVNLMVHDAFIIAAECFGCRPTSIPMMQENGGIGSRRATPARHFLIYLLRYKMKYDVKTLAILFGVSESTIWTAVIKHSNKMEQNEAAYTASLLSCEKILKHFSSAKKTDLTKNKAYQTLTINIQ